jgi:thiamine biosynthesis protein ThiS
MAAPSAMIRVRLNGEERALPPGTTLPSLLESLGLDRRFLVIEYNGEALSRSQVGAVVLHPGDRLELVRPVAGG